MKPRALSEEVEAEVTVRGREGFIRILESSLRPEVERPSSARTRASLKAEGSVLKLEIIASDITALRAALNSYLRWVQSISDVVERTRPAGAQQ